MTNRTPGLSEKDDILAAEYALGVLQGQARQDFERRLVGNPALAATVRMWDEHFVSFAEDIAPVAPPKHIANALESLLFATPKPSLWSSLGFWRGLAMASLAAAVTLGAWNLRSPTETPAGALVAQVAGETNAVKLVAYYDETKGELRLNRTDGTPATGRSFELWLIAGQDAPVSMGVLPDAAAGKILVPTNLRSKLKDGTLAISDEPTGGSKTGAPTGAVLATGSLTAV